MTVEQGPEGQHRPCNCLCVRHRCAGAQTLDPVRVHYGNEKGGKGFDTKILKKVVALRKKDEQERMEEDAILDTYLHALGMIESPPEG